jgi:hypothetical protein
VPVVLLLAIVAVLVAVFFAATGRGGELSYEPADHAPLDLGPVSATDVALLRPPTALWGYNIQVTDEALDRIARAMRDRDVTIAYLQQQLADLDQEPALGGQSVLTRPDLPALPHPGARPAPSGLPTRPVPRFRGDQEDTQNLLDLLELRASLAAQEPGTSADDLAARDLPAIPDEPAAPGEPAAAEGFTDRADAGDPDEGAAHAEPPAPDEAAASADEAAPASSRAPGEPAPGEDAVPETDGETLAQEEQSR